MTTPEVGATGPLEPGELDERTRNRLLRAAVNVFDRKGYTAASVREIVELAGVTKPALYYHFGNKDGVLIAILEEGAREFQAAVARATAHPGSTRDRLFALFDEVNALFERHVPVVRVAHAVLHGPAEGMPQFDFCMFNREFQAAVCRILEAGRAAGEVRPVDPEVAALALMGIVGVCAAHQLHPERQPLGPDQLRRVIDAVCDGVLVSRRSADLQGRRAGDSGPSLDGESGVPRHGGVACKENQGK